MNHAWASEIPSDPVALGKALCESVDLGTPGYEVMRVDNEMRTWWQPAEGDTQPTLTSSFGAPATIHAVRLLWRDIGLDTKNGVAPGPFRYRVELETAKDQWTTILDRSDSTANG